MTCSPILFLIFNRPDTAARVFASIREARPRKLYIAADGPRSHRTGEDVLCEEVRNIALGVDWPCQVQTLFRTENLGCKRAVSDAIDWFFENEPEGIILEDDCLPTQDFFRFCDELLDRYRDDTRVGSISGDNFISSTWKPKESYYFSRFSHIWGWATWRRAWSKYDVNMADWSKPGTSLVDCIAFKGNRRAANYWGKLFDKVKDNQIDTWDYQWAYACFKNDWLCCLPSTNLVSNIGFGLNATHTRTVESKLANINTEQLEWPLSHPQAVSNSEKADNWTLDHVFEIKMHSWTIGRLMASLRYRLSLFTQRVSRPN